MNFIQCPVCLPNTVYMVVEKTTWVNSGMDSPKHALCIIARCHKCDRFVQWFQYFSLSPEGTNLEDFK